MFGDMLPEAVKGDPILAEHWEAMRRLLSARAPALFATQTVVGAANRRQPIPYVPDLAWATTTSAVATTDSTFTVDTIVRFNGASWVGDDPLTVKNDPDGYEIDTDIRGKIIYCYDDDDEWAWHPFDFPCPV